MNCCFHCITETLPHESLTENEPSYLQETHDEVHKTKVDFLTVQAAVIPTSVLPAPQGSTIIPERARLRKRQNEHRIGLEKTLTHFQTSCSDLFLGKSEWKWRV